MATVAGLVAELLAVRTRHLDQGVSLKKQYDALRQPGRSALRDVHEALDAAVIEAFNFVTGSDVTAQLLALNQAVASDPYLACGPGIDLPCTRSSTYRLVAPVL